MTSSIINGLWGQVRWNVTKQRIFALLLALIAIGQAMAVPTGPNGTNEATPNEKFARAEIYFVPWWVVTSAPMRPADVRRRPYVSLTVNNETYANRFVAWLNVDDLPLSPKGSGFGDIRLVIDLIDRLGQRVTYCADRFYLMTEDGVQRRPIDKKFRQTICEGTLMPTMSSRASCNE